MDNPERNDLPAEIEPESITDIRNLLRTLTEMTDRGEIESLHVYASLRANDNGDYFRDGTCAVDRHMEAGFLMELAMNSLGFKNVLRSEDE